jgi:hypothetical protein
MRRLGFCYTRTGRQFFDDRARERAPLFRVHECVFGILALESEPVDPRL